ncbi:hypothetical protein J1N35_008338 [Gossypium stocksii]|uniref:F-box domain-containing protein n=1 Tax=Gossypium stocksii TaxID=47602 RepID=A0A9D4AGE5_9ROSI|nr:hypothetical protein J1N35_008338 [Gossypium stocksii]
MSRRVRQKREHSWGEKTNISSETLDCGSLTSATISGVDWTTLPDDTVIQLFSYLNYRDRASLASTCQTFRLLSSSPCLWGSLDLRSHRFDTGAAVSLSPRCKNLQRLKFHAAGSADALLSLQARELREISGDFCRDITDAALSVIAARHEMLESVHFGPDACERISSDAIKALAYCCPRLRRLWMSGVKEVNGDATNALAEHCKKLEDVGFVESDNIDEVALGNLNSVKFLSVAGTRNLKWGSAAQEEVQERAATTVATLVVIDDENATDDCQRAEAILRGDGIRLLLDLARSCQEGLQSEAAKAIADLSIDSKVAKAVAESGGINILANLAKSMNRLVAEEAAGGLWNISFGDDHKGAIAEACGIKALVDLIFKWSSNTDELLEHATGALANLGADEKRSMEVVVLVESML